jgi:uncharacterized protein (UPF0276 family)
MEFSVNYSLAAADLLRQGEIHFDRFKCPAWPDLVATAQDLHPIYVHFPLRVGSGMGDAIDTETDQPADWGKVERLLAQTDTPFVNLHFAPKAADYPDIPVDTTQPDHIEMLIERTVQDTRTVVARFGTERIIVENNYARTGHLVQLAHSPEVIRRVIEESGCGFLFDVSHARLAAPDLGRGIREYIRELPVEHTREIHVTGIQRLDGPWIDAVRHSGVDAATIQTFAGQLSDHLPMTPKDWEFAAWMMEQVHNGAWGRPWTVAFEVGGIGGLFEAVAAKEILEEQIPRLHSLVTGHVSLLAGR